MAVSPIRAGIWIPLTLVLTIAFLIRIIVVMSPLGWLEADEAIVGLMARHILQGERPLFYWGQQQGYLGALEAYSVALVFFAFGALVAPYGVSGASQ